MKRLIVVALFLNAILLAGRFWQELDVHAGPVKCASENGDVNGDGTKDITDPIVLLGNLFLGNPPELVPICEAQNGSGLSVDEIALLKDHSSLLIVHFLLQFLE